MRRGSGRVQGYALPTAEPTLSLALAVHGTPARAEGQFLGRRRCSAVSRSHSGRAGEEECHFQTQGTRHLAAQRAVTSGEQAGTRSDRLGRCRHGAVTSGLRVALPEAMSSQSVRALEHRPATAVRLGRHWGGAKGDTALPDVASPHGGEEGFSSRTVLVFYKPQEQTFKMACVTTKTQL